MFHLTAQWPFLLIPPNPKNICSLTPYVILPENSCENPLLKDVCIFPVVLLAPVIGIAINLAMGEGKKYLPLYGCKQVSLLMRGCS